MPRRPLRPNEISSGGVVVRPTGAGHEICLVGDGHHWGFPKGLIEAPAGTPLHPDAAEIDEAAWLGIAEARRRLTFKGSVEILDAAAAELAEGRPEVAP